MLDARARTASGVRTLGAVNITAGTKGGTRSARRSLGASVANGDGLQLLRSGLPTLQGDGSQSHSEPELSLASNGTGGCIASGRSARDELRS